MARRSHPLRVRELKPLDEGEKLVDVASHPLRVRELKHGTDLTRKEQIESHPLRVRELKPRVTALRLLTFCCRTLYGCVN